MCVVWAPTVSRNPGWLCVGVAVIVGHDPGIERPTHLTVSQDNPRNLINSQSTQHVIRTIIDTESTANYPRYTGHRRKHYPRQYVTRNAANSTTSTDYGAAFHVKYWRQVLTQVWQQVISRISDINTIHTGVVRSLCLNLNDHWQRGPYVVYRVQVLNRTLVRTSTRTFVRTSWCSTNAEQRFVETWTIDSDYIESKRYL